MFTRLIGFLITLVCAAGLVAAELSLPADVAVQKRATLNLTLVGAGEDLAGFQCDLEFDADLLDVGVAPGPAALAAGKGVVVTALGAGKRRLLVAGMNQTVIRDGAVVQVTVEIKAPPSSRTTYTVRIQNAIGTDKEGRSASIRGSEGSLVAGE